MADKEKCPEPGCNKILLENNGLYKCLSHYSYRKVNGVLQKIKCPCKNCQNPDCDCD